MENYKEQYRVIEQIMANPEWDEATKIFKIQYYLRNWLTAEQALGWKYEEKIHVQS